MYLTSYYWGYVTISDNKYRQHITSLTRSILSCSFGTQGAIGAPTSALKGHGEEMQV